MVRRSLAEICQLSVDLIESWEVCVYSRTLIFIFPLSNCLPHKVATGNVVRWLLVRLIPIPLSRAPLLACAFKWPTSNTHVLLQLLSFANSRKISANNWNMTWRTHSSDVALSASVARTFLAKDKMRWLRCLASPNASLQFFSVEHHLLLNSGSQIMCLWCL